MRLSLAINMSKSTIKTDHTTLYLTPYGFLHLNGLTPQLCLYGSLYLPALVYGGKVHTRPTEAHQLGILCNLQ